MYYVLSKDFCNGRVPINEENHSNWVEFIKEYDRRVAYNVIGNYKISTVFLGIDHNFECDGAPILSETMVFPVNTYSDIFCKRARTWEEAEDNHREAIDYIASLSGV